MTSNASEMDESRPYTSFPGTWASLAGLAFGILGVSSVLWNAFWFRAPDWHGRAVSRWMPTYLSSILATFGFILFRGTFAGGNRRFVWGLGLGLASSLFVASGVGYRPDGMLWSSMIVICCAMAMWNGHMDALPGEISLPVEAVAEVDVLESVETKEPNNRLSRILQTLALFSAILLLFLLNFGAWSQAIGYRRHPPRGTFHLVTYSDNSTALIHAYCSGPTSSDLPTLASQRRYRRDDRDRRRLGAFFLDVGGGGHSSSDMYGMVSALTGLGRRVCVYDPPGTGWSGPATAAAQGGEPIIDQLTSSLNEKGPFILIGTMDGGAERIYRFALEHPEMVAALVPIAYGPGEFRTYQQARNLSDTDAVSYARKTLASRLQLGDLILSIGINFDVMPFLVPSDPSFIPHDLEPEKTFLNLLNEKQWATQVDYLARLVRAPERALEPSLWESNGTLDSRIQVLVLVTPRNGTAECLARGLELDGIECGFVRREIEIEDEFTERLGNMTAGSKVVKCVGCEGYLSSGKNLEWAVKEIMDGVGGIRRRKVD